MTAPMASVSEPRPAGVSGVPALPDVSGVVTPREGSDAAAGAAAAFEPVILGFTCNWCSYRAADLAGTSRIPYPPNIRLVRLMCSGRLDPTFVLRAFADGADAVVVTGCWPGECHYQVQNLKALRRFLLLRRVLVDLGIERARFQLVWASAAEGQRLAREIARITDEVRALGPLDWPATGREVDDPGPAPVPVGARPEPVEVGR